jgi:hypothetical protein
VLIPDGAIEPSLRNLVARRREMNLSELRVGRVIGPRRATQREGDRGHDENDSRLLEHEGLLPRYVQFDVLRVRHVALTGQAIGFKKA